MTQANADYYATRAAAERRLSAEANDVRAARAHCILAESYEALAANCQAEHRMMRMIAD